MSAYMVYKKGDTIANRPEFLFNNFEMAYLVFLYTVSIFGLGKYAIRPWSKLGDIDPRSDLVWRGSIDLFNKMPTEAGSLYAIVSHSHEYPAAYSHHKVTMDIGLLRMADWQFKWGPAYTFSLMDDKKQPVEDSATLRHRLFKKMLSRFIGRDDYGETLTKDQVDWDIQNMFTFKSHMRAMSLSTSQIYSRIQSPDKDTAHEWRDLMPVFYKGAQIGKVSSIEKNEDGSLTVFGTVNLPGVNWDLSSKISYGHKPATTTPKKQPWSVQSCTSRGTLVNILGWYSSYGEACSALLYLRTQHSSKLCVVDPVGDIVSEDAVVEWFSKTQVKPSKKETPKPPWTVRGNGTGMIVGSYDSFAEASKACEPFGKSAYGKIVGYAIYSPDGVRIQYSMKTEPMIFKPAPGRYEIRLVNADGSIGGLVSAHGAMEGSAVKQLREYQASPLYTKLFLIDGEGVVLTDEVCDAIWAQQPISKLEWFVRNETSNINLSTHTNYSMAATTCRALANFDPGVKYSVHNKHLVEVFSCYYSKDGEQWTSDIRR